VIFACPANPRTASLRDFELCSVGLLTGSGCLSASALPREAGHSFHSAAVLLIVSNGFHVFYLHEGGHALANLILGKHRLEFLRPPFTFSAFVRPFIDNLLLHAMGYITNLLVSFVIFCLFLEAPFCSTLLS